ncbi:MAG: hypothetical protein ABI183_03655 [Polyangiaceae bacterium]
MRDTLFGDMPLDEWLANSNATTIEPWISFRSARDFLKSGENAEAQQALLRITALPNLEARMTLQAWNALRSLGHAPPPEVASYLYGVVVEVGMESGLDLLAAYSDFTARYWNYSGSGVAWERPSPSLNPHVKRVLDAGRAILPNIGVWESPRRPAPDFGVIRLSMLTPAGIAFGEGPFEVLAEDPMAGPLIDAATSLMQQLTELTRR